MSKKIVIFLIILGLLVVSVVTIFFAMTVSYNQLTDNLVNVASANELVLAKQTASIIATEVQSIQEKMYLISLIPEIKNGDEKLCNQKITQILQLDPHISNIGRVDINHKFVCSYNKSLVGLDATTLGPYISQIFNDPQHNPVMSRIIHLPTGGYAVGIHIPIFDEQGLFNGTLGGAIYFNELQQKYINDVKLSKNTYIVLEDDDGTVLSHPDATNIGKSFWPKNSAQEATESALTKKLIQSSESDTSGIQRYRLQNGQEKVAGYAPANVFPGRRWLVIVTSPIDDAKNLVISSGIKITFLQLLIIVSLVVVFSLSLLLLYIFRSIFKPLGIIQKFADQIAIGNLNIHIPYKGKDEIGKLATSFNDMVVKLKESRTDLEKKVEERTIQLREYAKELDDAQHASRFGSFTYNLITDQGIWSRETFELFGVPFSNQVPTLSQLKQLVLPEDAERAQDEFKKLSLAEKAFDFEIRIRKSDNNFHYIRCRGKSEFKDNQLIQIVGTFQDVTKEKELEQLKDEFVSIASHELRTPMTAIKGFISMIEEGDYGYVSTELKEPLSDMKASTERLIHLVNDMLNVSRIEAGRLKFNLIEFDLGPVLLEVISSLQPIAAQKGVILETQKIQNCIVQADVDKVKQVLNNLVGNSLKFTEKGGIWISVMSNSEMIKVLIKDSGMGIDPKNQQKLFGKFQQISSQQEGKPVGTGLGLYLSKTLIGRMGGDLVIEESALGKGSTFSFTLPLANSQSAKKIKELISEEAQIHSDQKDD